MSGWQYMAKARTKTRNNETKPSERNHRNTGTKPREASKHRNKTSDKTETAIKTALVMTRNVVSL